MYFIYNCYGGSHSSVTAACIHVGLLKEDKIPSSQELISLPYYDAQIAKDHGYLRFIGKDHYGNKVFICGKRNLGNNYERILRSVASIAEIDNEILVFIDTMSCVNLLMIIGGYLSRKLGLIGIGRPLVIKGTQLSFFKFSHLTNIIKTKYGRIKK